MGDDEPEDKALEAVLTANTWREREAAIERLIGGPLYVDEPPRYVDLRRRHCETGTR